MKPLFLIFFSILSLFGYSQSKQTDSLFNVLKTSKNQENNVLLYSQLSKLYKSTDLDMAIYYAKTGSKLADSLKYNLGIAEMAANLGDYYVTKNNLDSAKSYYLRARQFFHETDSLFKYTENSMRLGNVNLAQNNYTEALILYQECLKICKEN